LFDSIPAGIVLIQREKITDINKMALDRLGYNAEEVIGHDFLDFVHPDQKATVKTLHKKRVSRKVVPEQYETDLVTKDGEKLCCHVRIKRIRHNGRMAFIANLIPLHKIIEKEKENIQSKKIEALTTMATGLTDEFSRYFETIIRNSKNLKAIADTKNRDLMEYIERIESTTKRALLTAQKLDSFSKEENDQSDMTLLNLKKVVEDAVELINLKWRDEPEGHYQKINLKTFLRVESPIEGNRKEIQDVMINMIMNAADAMPKGGDIYLTAEENEGYAHIYIQDSGVGISKQIKDRIFDPFFTTRGNDGIGLGLSLAYAIVKRHGGEVEVSSQKDQGTIFHIKLPLASQKSISKARSHRRKIKDTRILIIEGEDILRELLSQLLVDKGCSVVTAESGLEGLGILEKKEFDLIIADAEKSGIDRQLLVKKIKRMNRDLTIILIAECEASDKLDHIQRSAVGLIIVKPIDMNKIVKQVSEVLSFQRH